MPQPTVPPCDPSNAFKQRQIKKKYMYIFPVTLKFFDVTQYDKIQYDIIETKEQKSS
jgi:hypothetical protein